MESRVVTSISALDPEKPLRYRTFAELVISNASRCAAVIPSASIARRRGRGSAMRLETRDQTPKRELVSQDSKAAHDADGCVGERGVSSLRLSRIDVRDVNLHEWDVDTHKRVAEGEAGIRVRARIHERAVDAPPHSVHSVDQRALTVMLGELHVGAELFRDRSQPQLDIRQRVVSV